ncbi:PREDICTED: uncharacterized protein LOC109380073 [Hipposideros armiger]|uniref:Uncharacterized protein LOC109380073 n=1 Tax=Hipposideros armiger TaxID=186990 RepID=A0A8B7QYK7_HIPAR|nr:PREDICTED: uncharacterized protein LOC109380073 [Hipposideros armiger]
MPRSGRGQQRLLGLARTAHFPHPTCATGLRPVLCPDTRQFHLQGLAQTARDLASHAAPSSVTRPAAPRGWRYPDVTKSVLPTVVARRGAPETFIPPLPALQVQVFLLSSVLGTGCSCVPFEAQALLCVAPLRPVNAASSI